MFEKKLDQKSSSMKYFLSLREIKKNRLIKVITRIYLLGLDFLCWEFRWHKKKKSLIGYLIIIPIFFYNHRETITKYWFQIILLFEQNENRLN